MRRARSREGDDLEAVNGGSSFLGGVSRQKMRDFLFLGHQNYHKSRYVVLNFCLLDPSNIARTNLVARYSKDPSLSVVRLSLILLLTVNHTINTNKRLPKSQIPFCANPLHSLAAAACMEARSERG